MTKTVVILGAINSALALLLAFGVDVTQAQQAAITGAVNAALILWHVIRDPNIPFGLKKKD